jgi:hypothetical protein
LDFLIMADLLETDPTVWLDKPFIC